MSDEPKKPPHPRMVQFQTTAKEAGYSTLAVPEFALETYAFSMNNILKFADWIIIALLTLVGILLNVGADEIMLSFYRGIYASPLIWGGFVLITLFWIFGPMKYKDSIRHYSLEIMFYIVVILLLISGKALVPESIQPAVTQSKLVELAVRFVTWFWSLTFFRSLDVWMMGIVGVAALGVKLWFLKRSAKVRKAQVEAD